MLSNLFLKTLYDRQRNLTWWALGIISLVILIMLFFPAIQDVPAFDELIEAYPEELLRAFAGEIQSFTSPEGYLNSQLFFFVTPLLFLIFAIGFGASAIAGEEEKGTLDLLLSHPLPRWLVVLEKYAALTASLVLLHLIMFASLVVGAALVDMDITGGRLAEVTIANILLALPFGALALALGCATGKRGLAIGVSAAVAVASYFLNALAPVIETLEGAEQASPFYYYIGADPLSNGLDYVHVAVLAAITVVFLAISLITFQRRDLS